MFEQSKFDGDKLSKVVNELMKLYSLLGKYADNYAITSYEKYVIQQAQTLVFKNYITDGYKRCSK